MHRTVPCQDCPLRKRDCFRPFSPSELAFVSVLKSGELTVEAGATVLEQGSSSTHVFTVLSGIGFRQKMLDDGRQQILNFIMPGDLVGLQAALFEEMEHSVESLTDMTLCIFQRSELPDVFRKQPDLGYTVVWHAAREERMLDEQLMSVGRRTARERIAHSILSLHDKATRRGLANADGRVPLPIRQRQLADALGLSVVHTNKTLRQLTSAGHMRWHSGRLEVRNRAELAQIAGYEGNEDTLLPLI
jgi:CRP-like cAMP-binding protein